MRVREPRITLAPAMLDMWAHTKPSAILLSLREHLATLSKDSGASPLERASALAEVSCVLIGVDMSATGAGCDGGAVASPRTHIPGHPLAGLFDWLLLPVDDDVDAMPAGISRVIKAGGRRFCPGREQESSCASARNSAAGNADSDDDDDAASSGSDGSSCQHAWPPLALLVRMAATTLPPLLEAAAAAADAAGLLSCGDTRAGAVRLITALLVSAVAVGGRSAANRLLASALPLLLHERAATSWRFDASAGLFAADAASAEAYARGRVLPEGASAGVLRGGGSGGGGGGGGGNGAFTVETSETARLALGRLAHALLLAFASSPGRSSALEEVPAELALPALMLGHALAAEPASRPDSLVAGSVLLAVGALTAPRTARLLAAAAARSLAAGALCHRSVRVRLAALGALEALVATPDPMAGGGRGIGAGALLGLLGSGEAGVLPVAAFYSPMPARNALARLADDVSIAVRRRFLCALGVWMLALPCRHEWWSRLMPYLLAAAQDTEDDDAHAPTDSGCRADAAADAVTGERERLLPPFAAVFASPMTWAADSGNAGVCGMRMWAAAAGGDSGDGGNENSAPVASAPWPVGHPGPAFLALRARRAAAVGTGHSAAAAAADAAALPATVSSDISAVSLPLPPPVRVLALAILEACGAEHAATHAPALRRRLQACIDDDGGDGGESTVGRPLPPPFDRPRVVGAGDGRACACTCCAAAADGEFGGHSLCSVMARFACVRKVTCKTRCFRPSRGVRLFVRAHGGVLLRALLQDLADYVEWGGRALSVPDRASAAVSLSSATAAPATRLGMREAERVTATAHFSTQQRAGELAEPRIAGTDFVDWALQPRPCCERVCERAGGSSSSIRRRCGDLLVSMLCLFEHGAAAEVHRLAPTLALVVRDAQLGGSRNSPAAWAARLLGRFVPTRAFLPPLLPLIRGDAAGGIGTARARSRGGHTAVAVGALTALLLALEEAPSDSLVVVLPALLSAGADFSGGRGNAEEPAMGTTEDVTAADAATSGVAADATRVLSAAERWRSGHASRAAAAAAVLEAGGGLLHPALLRRLVPTEPTTAARTLRELWLAAMRTAAAAAEAAAAAPNLLKAGVVTSAATSLASSVPALDALAAATATLPGSFFDVAAIAATRDIVETALKSLAACGAANAAT